MALLDDSLLRNYARANGLRFAWRTRRDGTHWHADIQLWRGREKAGGVKTSTMEGEQRALDFAIGYVIAGPPRAKPEGPINLGNPLGEGRAGDGSKTRW